MLLRKILCKHFGEDCKVYEDVFHASKRPSTAIGRTCLGKRYQKFTNEVAHSFRHENDTKPGGRKMSTIGRKEIVTNLTRVKNNWPEIPEKAMWEIEKLIKHAEKGADCD